MRLGPGGQYGALGQVVEELLTEGEVLGGDVRADHHLRHVPPGVELLHLGGRLDGDHLGPGHHGRLRALPTEIIQSRRSLTNIGSTCLVDVPLQPSAVGSFDLFASSVTWAVSSACPGPASSSSPDNWSPSGSAET